MNSLGERLRHARKVRQMSQQELARKAAVSQQLISQLERGETTVSAYHIALSKALDISLDWLVDGQGQMTPMADGELDKELHKAISILPKSYKRTVLAMIKSLPINQVAEDCADYRIE